MINTIKNEGIGYIVKLIKKIYISFVSIYNNTNMLDHYTSDEMFNQFQQITEFNIYFSLIILLVLLLYYFWLF